MFIGFLTIETFKDPEGDTGGIARTIQKIKKFYVKQKLDKYVKNYNLLKTYVQSNTKVGSSAGFCESIDI